ncbi:MAG: FkbM family methyltransferase [Novosphingobium sp.]
MLIYDAIKRLAALAGAHVEKLAKQPGTTVLGLVHRPIDTVIDVGANTGQFAREMRGKFPRAHIISFEPLPEPFAELQAWARADGNATAVNIGLGESEGVLPFHRHVGHSASSSLLPTHSEGVARFPQMGRAELTEIRVRRLDDALADLGRDIGPRTLLKLDVQGFEEQVMRGAERTLGQVAALITEVNVGPMFEGQAEFLALCTRAYAAGLRYAGNYAQYPAPDGEVIFLDAMFVR